MYSGVAAQRACVVLLSVCLSDLGSAQRITLCICKAYFNCYRAGKVAPGGVTHCARLIVLFELLLLLWPLFYGTSRPARVVMPNKRPFQHEHRSPSYLC